MIRSSLAIDSEVHGWFKRVLAAIHAQTGKELPLSLEVEQAVKQRGDQLLSEFGIELGPVMVYEVGDEG